MKIPYLFILLATSSLLGDIPAPAGASTTRISVMGANITSDGQKYGAPGIRCFQGLTPDIVLIQEFNPPDGQTLEQFVMTAFDSSFEFYCEPTGSIPNGIISRYPILSSGYWNDSEVPDRNFVWAVIDIPGEIDLQCVSIHLKTDSSSTQNNEANAIKDYVAANFDSDQYIVVGGDLNTSSEGASAIGTFDTFLNASNHRPRDQDGNQDTNKDREKPYDWVMPNALLDACNTGVVFPSRTYNDGLVFDSRVFTPLSEVSPVQENDCSQFQHMPVMKCFNVPVTTPTPAPSPSPRPTIAPPYLLDEGFDGYQTGTRPSGWTFTGCSQNSDTYLETGYYGRTAPSLKLENDGDRIETSVFAGPRQLTFWYRGVAAGGGDALALEEFYGASWRAIETLYYLPDGGDRSGPWDLNPSTSQLRFTFYRTSGALAFDDVAVNALFVTPSPTVTPVPTASPTASPIPTTTAVPTRTPAPSPTPSTSPSSTPTPPARHTVAGDYTGNGTTDIALFRPSAGLWLIRGFTRAYFGTGTDSPVPRDYDGDGTWEIAVYRPATGKWAVAGGTTAYYGAASDIPIPGDYAGDGTDAIAVFRPAIGKWLVRGWTGVYYGSSADRTVPADYNGDGTVEVAVFRPAIGKWLIRGGSGVYYGVSADQTLPADYNGDGSADIAVFRAASGRWLVRGGSSAYFGLSTDTPVPGDFNGDGSADFAVFRADSGKWLIRNLSAVYYGVSTDVPVVR